MQQSYSNLTCVMALSMVLIFLSSCTSPKSSDAGGSSWQLIYRNDKDGHALQGDKNDLIQAVRNGQSIRVGWGVHRPDDTTKSVEHVADAQFLTIANSEEVFAQITPIIGQRPDLNADTLGVTFHEPLSWIIMVGSNGFTDRMMTNRLKDTIQGHRQLFSEISWFVERNSADASRLKNPAPLWAK